MPSYGDAMQPATTTPPTIRDLAREYHEVGHDVFLARYESPALVLLEGSADDVWGDFHTRFGEHERKWREPPTNAFAVPDISLEPEHELRDEHTVLFVAKRPDAPFPDRVGIGRARNVDVPVPLPRLSKYHAFFSRSEDGSEHFLTDAGSRNGTIVDGTELAPKTPHRLRDGSDIRLGGHGLRFFLPPGLCDLLARWRA